ATGKRFREGLDQLLREGVAQAFELNDSLSRTPLLGAVGPLQFEVLQYRLESEYGALCRIETAPWGVVRWVRAKDGSGGVPALILPTGAKQARDASGAHVALLTNAWSLGYFESKNPDYEISPQPFAK
ncbi:MAG TPA: peptide chain release factor 3, partial [Chthoniobacterales bacterium]|nr:peptide chain release factor 3 [Chthoniobacterales bacterium]